MAVANVPKHSIPKALLPLLACLLFVVPHGAISFPCDQCICTSPSTSCWVRLPSIASLSNTFAHMLIVGIFGCGPGSLWIPWLVCVYTAFRHKIVMHCVLWYLSIRTSMNSCSNFYYSTYWLRQHKPAFTHCTAVPWPRMILLLVPRFTFLGPLLVDPGLCILGTSHKCFKYKLFWSCGHHKMALVRVANIFTLVHLFDSNVFTSVIKCWLAA